MFSQLPQHHRQGRKRIIISKLNNLRGITRKEERVGLQFLCRESRNEKAYASSHSMSSATARMMMEKWQANNNKYILKMLFMLGCHAFPEPPIHFSFIIFIASHLVTHFTSREKKVLEASNPP